MPAISLAGAAKLEFFLNELSLEGQFPDVHAFEAALDVIMGMRTLIRAQGLSLRSPRTLGCRMAVREQRLEIAVHQLPHAKVSALLAWLNREGPFWDDDRVHSSGDWLEIAGEPERIVTDSALGEAAWRCHLGEAVETISFPHNYWSLSPLLVALRGDTNIEWQKSIANHIAQPSLAVSLEKALSPMRSWTDLRQRATTRFENLFFSTDAFSKLEDTPFAVGPAEQLMRRLQILSKLKDSLTTEGAYTPAGDQLYQAYFTGGRAWFTDSSESEKRDFANELRFRHPERPEEYINGFWHGKINTPKLRIHFSWPFTLSEATYILYVGPKITKR